MNSNSIVFLLLALTLVTVNATNHTTCFNYFLKKDKCVSAAASEDLRCKIDPQNHATPVKAFKSPPVGSSSRLTRRYDAPKKSFPIASGDGICKKYDSEKELGVCLWSGAEQKNPTLTTAGWLNGLKTSNCGKTVYIQRTGDPKSVQYAKVIDGCFFGATAPEPGCFEIGVTLALFKLFKPTAEEIESQQLLGGLTWDFNNLFGNSTQQAPV